MIFEANKEFMENLSLQYTQFVIFIIYNPLRTKLEPTLAMIQNIEEEQMISR